MIIIWFRFIILVFPIAFNVFAILWKIVIVHSVHTQTLENPLTKYPLSSGWLVSLTIMVHLLFSMYVSKCKCKRNIFHCPMKIIIFKRCLSYHMTPKMYHLVAYYIYFGPMTNLILPFQCGGSFSLRKIYCARKKLFVSILFFKWISKP